MIARRQSDSSRSEAFDQIGSFDKQHITKHLNGKLEPFIRECAVTVRTLPEILKKHQIEQLHLLHIDTEGHDYDVLKTVDLAKLAPTLILVEHAHLRPSDKTNMLTLLEDNGYSVSDCGRDYFGVSKSADVKLRRIANMCHQ